MARNPGKTHAFVDEALSNAPRRVMTRAPCSLGPGARGHVVWGAGGGAALRDWRPGAGGHAVWGAGGCEHDGWVLGGIQLGLLVGVPGGCCFASLTARCQGACSLGCLCMVVLVLVQVLLWGVV